MEHLLEFVSTSEGEILSGTLAVGHTNEWMYSDFFFYLLFLQMENMHCA